MRKLIITILAMLVPFGLWTAGCRQDKRVAAFPTTPEMKNIARAPEQDYATRPPAIPAAIDREILNTPDQPTFARIRAVMDRSEILTNRPSDPGLFLLPPQDEAAMAYNQQQPAMPAYHEMPAPVYVSEPPAIYQAAAPMPPAPTGREFYSRPASRTPQAPQTVPHDVSAMMPAAAPAPAPVVHPSGGAPIILPEDIPGVFMGSDDGAQNWIGMVKNRIESSNEPPMLSAASFDSVSVDELNAHKRQAQPTLQAWRPLADGPDLDLVALLTPTKSPPEADSEASPQLSEKLTALLNDNDIRQALEPLPDISAMALPPPEELVAAAPPEAKPAPVPATPVSAPPVLAAPALESFAALDLSPAKTDTASAVDSRDFYRMDVKGPVAAPALAVPILSTEPAESRNDTVGIAPDIVKTTDAPSAAQKVTLQPVSTSLRPKNASSDLSRIDAETAVPPLRF